MRTIRELLHEIVICHKNQLRITVNRYQEGYSFYWNAYHAYGDEPVDEPERAEGAERHGGGEQRNGVAGADGAAPRATGNRPEERGDPPQPADSAATGRGAPPMAATAQGERTSADRLRQAIDDAVDAEVQRRRDRIAASIRPLHNPAPTSTTRQESVSSGQHPTGLAVPTTAEEAVRQRSDRNAALEAIRGIEATVSIIRGRVEQPAPGSGTDRSARRLQDIRTAIRDGLVPDDDGGPSGLAEGSSEDEAKDDNETASNCSQSTTYTYFSETDFARLEDPEEDEYDDDLPDLVTAADIADSRLGPEGADGDGGPDGPDDNDDDDDDAESDIELDDAFVIASQWFESHRNQDLRNTSRRGGGKKDGKTVQRSFWPSSKRGGGRRDDKRDKGDDDWNQLL